MADYLVVFTYPNDDAIHGVAFTTDHPDEAEDELEKMIPEGKVRDIRPFDHAACMYSMGICGSLTAGQGDLGDNGYWQFMCPKCAKAAQEQIDAPDDEPDAEATSNGT